MKYYFVTFDKKPKFECTDTFLVRAEGHIEAKVRNLIGPGAEIIGLDEMFAGIADCVPGRLEPMRSLS